MTNLPNNPIYDIWSSKRSEDDISDINKKLKTIQEIMHDDVPKNKHYLKEQTQLHQNIRNDSDYDDWEYGTDVSYGFSWK